VGVDFDGFAAGRQVLWLRVTRQSFARDLAPARTFALAEELEDLRAAGLALGGSEENAFAVGRDGYSGELRFPDEVVRHKALDLLGDLALCGGRLDGQVMAIRPSHSLNVQLAGSVRAALEGGDAGEHRARSN
jgi:UDP-3-O-[3-hydroxymyristoyl] N-acetylglucosamine deacetylase